MSYIGRMDPVFLIKILHRSFDERIGQSSDTMKHKDVFMLNLLLQSMFHLRIDYEDLRKLYKNC